MRNRAAIVAASVAAVVGVFILLLATSEAGHSTTANFEVLGEVGDQIEGPTLDGGEFALWDERGDWVVVNFFASWCVGCRVEHPELVEFTQRHQGDGVQLVSVMFGDKEEDAQQFFDELGGDWPAIVANTGPIAIDYGVTAVPETLLISPSGRIVQKWVGSQGVTADVIDATISQLEGGG